MFLFFSRVLLRVFALNCSTKHLAPKHCNALPFIGIVSTMVFYAISTAAAQNHAQRYVHTRAHTTSPVNVMQQLYAAHKSRKQATLSQLLPKARGNMLEPYAAYWELSNRLETASEQEVQGFLRQWQGSYWEDRLRNDWLHELIDREDWARFLQHEALFRMQDDRAVRCHALRLGAKEATAPARAERAYANWLQASNRDQACLQAVETAYRKRLLTADQIWRRAALSIAKKHKTAVENAVRVVNPAATARVASIYRNPKRFIARANPQSNRYLITLALIRLAQKDHDTVAQHLYGKWGSRLNTQQASWAWAEVGRNAALEGERGAIRYFSQAQNEHLSQEQLAWKVRAALLAGVKPHADTIINAFNHMDAEQRNKPRWKYWLARALQAQNKIADAQAVFAKTAQDFPFDYYGMLAGESSSPAAIADTAAISGADRSWARNNTGLHRALYAIQNGIRHWGAREWNYHIRLFSPDGATPGQALAAAELACQQQVWDRCIRSASHAQPAQHNPSLLYPNAYLPLVSSHSRAHGLPSFFAMGLIRQESLFVTKARSHVGAGGLMQIMPATARWTAKQIGIENFNTRDRNNPDTNVLLGTYYFNKVYQDLDRSLPLTLAGYNAGPNRARRWRERGIADATIWNETIPFTETRNYVQKVLANMVVYNQRIPSNQPQQARVQLKDLMGQITPATHPYADLP